MQTSSYVRRVLLRCSCAHIYVSYFAIVRPIHLKPRFLKEHRKCYNEDMSDANRKFVRKSTLAEQGKDRDLRDNTIEERWDMMWQLAINAWAMKGVNVADQEFQRHVECLKRLKG